MTTYRPLVLTSTGVIEQMQSGDTLDPSTYTVGSSALVDGGSATTSHAGLLTIDFGKAT